MSVFALRPRELRATPQSIAAAGALSQDDLRRVLIAVGIALLFSSVLVFFLLSLPAAPQNASIATPHPVKPAWVEIAKPLRLFALVGSEWGREPARYTAERHRDGGGRRDHLSFGAFGADQPSLQLTLYRIGSEGADPEPFFVDMARHAAPAGFSVARMGQPKPLATRFGTFEAADFTLDGRAGLPGEGMHCIAFRLANPRILQIGGFACDAPRRTFDRARLGCTLDRIDLVSAGDDTELRGFFTGAVGDLGAACRNPAPTAEAGESAKAATGFVVVR